MVWAERPILGAAKARGRQAMACEGRASVAISPSSSRVLSGLLTDSLSLPLNYSAAAASSAQ
jgi:hypothetical protein